MQPTTVALGAGAALGVALLMSRATEGEPRVIAHTRVDPKRVIAGVDVNPRTPPAPQQSTLDAWQAEVKKNEHPQAIVEPEAKVTADPDPKPPIAGVQNQMSTLEYAKWTAAGIVGAAAVAGGAYAGYSEYSKDQAYDPSSDPYALGLRTQPLVQTQLPDGTWSTPQRHSDAWVMDYPRQQHVPVITGQDLRRGSIRLRGTM